MCYLHNDAMDLNLSSLGTLLPAAPCCVLCNKESNLLKVWHGWMVFASTLIWYRTHRKTHTKHTRTDRLQQIYKYILKRPVTSRNNYLYYTEWWITYWYKNLLYRGPQYLCFSKISLAEVNICWLDSKRLYTFCETQRILIETV